MCDFVEGAYFKPSDHESVLFWRGRAVTLLKALRCFTSTETIRLIRDGDGHLDFHTAHALYPQTTKVYDFVGGACSKPSDHECELLMK